MVVNVFKKQEYVIRYRWGVPGRKVLDDETPSMNVFLGGICVSYVRAIALS